MGYIEIDLHEHQISELELKNKFWHCFTDKRKLAIWRVASSLGHAWASYVSEDEIFNIDLQDIYIRTYEKNVEKRNKYSLPIGITHPDIVVYRSVSYYDKIGYVAYEHETGSGRLKIRVIEQCYSVSQPSGVEIKICRPDGSRFEQFYYLDYEDDIKNIRLEKASEYFYSTNEKEYSIWGRRHYLALRDVIAAITDKDTYFDKKEILEIIGANFGTLEYCDCLVVGKNLDEIFVNADHSLTYVDDSQLCYIKFADEVKFEFGSGDNSELFELSNGELAEVKIFSK